MFVWNNGILNLVWNNVILKISFPFLPLESSGVSKYRLCSLAQYINLVGVTIGYTITTAISMGYAFFFFFLRYILRSLLLAIDEIRSDEQLAK